MKVALILSVVALVAVSQPTFYFPPHPFQPCDLLRRGEVDMQCCIPPQFGGCQAPPGFRRPLPPNYLPPPDFLNNVCCEEGKECCVVDSTDFNVRFTCCDEDEECVETDNKGSCTTTNNTGTTPMVPHLESGGQCPHDGSLAIEVRPGEPWRCTFNSIVQGYTCPSNSHCVRDNTGNVNSGVCCRDTFETEDDGNITVFGCNKYQDCHSCVRNEDDDVRAACGWLTQGSLDNRNPRCVVSCDNFPQKSCILPSNGKLCPANALTGSDASNATIVNTGTCARRCGYIGTGRAAGINNNGNHPTTPTNASEVKDTTCCHKFPGDYCCDDWMQLASHCTVGRAPEGPLCGVPIRGTPNALYVPEYEPLGPYVPAPYGSGPTPYGMFPPYGQPYGYGPVAPGIPYGPYGPQFAYIGGGPQPMPYGPQPFGPVPFGPYGPYRQGEELSGKSASDLVKQLMYPPPPMFYPVPPPPVPVRIPDVVNVNPSPFVCSCDESCMEYADCCADLADHCEWAVNLPANSTSY